MSFWRFVICLFCSTEWDFFADHSSVGFYMSVCPLQGFLSFFRWVNGFVIIKVIMIGNKKMLEMAQLYDIRNGIVRPKKVDRTDQGWRREI